MVTQNLSVDELVAQIAAGTPTQIVDVRSTNEYDAMHIPGALNIPLEQLGTRVLDLQSRYPVVMVCQGGTRAGMACESLSGTSRNLWRLEGGTEAWIAGRQPVVRNAHQAWSLERQVRLTVGLITILGGTLGLTVSRSWIYLPLALGAGLAFTAVTNQCGLGYLLAQMPWNRRKQ